MNRESIKARFDELAARGAAAPASSEQQYVDTGWFAKWSSSAQNLISLVFGKESDHYHNFSRATQRFKGWRYEHDVAYGVFTSALEDWEKGFADTLESQVSSEIFGDFIALSKEALARGIKMSPLSWHVLRLKTRLSVLLFGTA